MKYLGNAIVNQKKEIPHFQYPLTKNSSEHTKQDLFNYEIKNTI